MIQSTNGIRTQVRVWKPPNDIHTWQDARAVADSRTMTCIKRYLDTYLILYSDSRHYVKICCMYNNIEVVWVMAPYCLVSYQCFWLPHCCPECGTGYVPPDLCTLCLTSRQECEHSVPLKTQLLCCKSWLWRVETEGARRSCLGVFWATHVPWTEII